jgi:ABC-2 type transport system permease protein
MNDIILMLLPGAMYFWVLFIGQGPLQEILQEKQNLILPRLLASPVTPGQYVVAKMLRCMVLCSLALILLLICSNLIFGIKWGNPFKLAGVVAMWAVSMTGLLALIYSLARTREQANVLSPLVLMLFAMLGGSMFPYESLPPFLQMIGQYSPNRWGVLVLQGVARSKPLIDVARPLLGLLALGVLGTGFAFLMFQRKLATGDLK